jgi:protein-S-isoprenylcysteine O-methyltransferase Ste14
MKTWTTWLTIAVAPVVFAVFVYMNREASWTAHQIVGIAIALPALCLWALARVQLRRSFAVSAQARELVTHGLYAKIQNPVYVFGAALIAGLIIYYGQPRYLFVFVILIPVQWVRIRNERRALEAKFGETYREYRRHTWF